MLSSVGRMQATAARALCYARTRRGFFWADNPQRKSPCPGASKSPGPILVYIRINTQKLQFGVHPCFGHCCKIIGNFSTKRVARFAGCGLPTAAGPLRERIDPPQAPDVSLFVCVRRKKRATTDDDWKPPPHGPAAAPNPRAGLGHVVINSGLD